MLVLVLELEQEPGAHGGFVGPWGRSAREPLHGLARTPGAEGGR